MDISSLFAQGFSKTTIKAQIISVEKNHFRIQIGKAFFDIPKDPRFQLGDFLLLNENGKIIQKQPKQDKTEALSPFLLDPKPLLISPKLHQLPVAIAQEVQSQWADSKITLPLLQKLEKHKAFEVIQQLIQNATPATIPFSENQWDILKFKTTPFSAKEEIRIWEQFSQSPHKVVQTLQAHPPLASSKQFINLQVFPEKVLPKLSFSPLFPTNLAPQEQKTLDAYLLSQTPSPPLPSTTPLTAPKKEPILFSPQEEPLTLSKKNTPIQPKTDKGISVSIPWPQAITPISQKVASLEQIPSPQIIAQFQQLQSAGIPITPSLLSEWIQQTGKQHVSPKDFLPFLLLGRSSDTPAMESFQLSQQSKNSPNLQEFVKDTLPEKFQIYTPNELAEQLSTKSPLKKMIFFKQWENQWQDEPAQQFYFSDGKQTQEIKLHVQDNRKKAKLSTDKDIRLSIQTQTLRLGALHIQARLTPKEELYLQINGEHKEHKVLFEDEQENLKLELLPLLLQEIIYKVQTQSAEGAVPISTTGSFDIRI